MAWPQAQARDGRAPRHTACAVIAQALAAYGFTAPNSLLCFQCLLAALLVKVAELCGFAHQPVQPLRWKLVRIWLPVNLVFVGMTGSSFYALKEVGVGAKSCDAVAMSRAVCLHLS